MKNKVKPKLRFPEFEDDLEVRTLGELMEFKNGINASKEQYGSGVKFVNVLDILSNDYITYDRIIGRVDVVEETVEKYAVNYGDVLFQRSSETREEVGTANVYLDEENTATFGGFVIRGKKIGEYNPVYLNELLKTDSVRDSITSRSGGSTRYNVGQNILASVSVRLPTLNEQAKIANFLSALDEKIQALTKKKILLEEYKKGIMQRLFSQEIRFKDDLGHKFPDWEKKRLGDIGKKFINGGTPSTKNESFWNGDIPWITGADFIDQTISEIRRYISPEAVIGSSTNVVRKGNLLVVTRTGVGKIAIAPFDIAISQDITGIYLNDNLNVNYLFQYFNFKDNDLKNQNQGTSINGITRSDLLNIGVDLPSIIEQRKIADFLISIDEKINESTQILKAVQIYKKGLLQKMFL